MNKRAGFTVIELLVAAAIFAVLVFVVASLRGNVNTLGNLVRQKLQSRQDLDIMLDQMVTEIRSAAPSSQGAFPVESASTSTLVFYSDIDADGLVERIRYAVGTSTLVRGVIKPSGSPLGYATSSEQVATVMTDLVRTTSTPVFAYYGAGQAGVGDPLPATSSQPSAVRAVRVTFYVDVRPREAPKPAFASQLVVIRNLRDE